MITGMAQFKSIEDYPATPCKEMSVEKLSAYQQYMDNAFQQSHQMALEAWKAIKGKVFPF